ncbi:hypothetical protein GCM10011514_12820 [Emticicia aquatilis]|uniref:Uncharacterized protein n=1 Tax=Emticicia aquatilis TaxID=1537369 RepID=A0A916YKH5_9BACT|nr:hypothetical protein GCM10011514_12820 [Emticicia aquatilis]
MKISVLQSDNDLKIYKYHFLSYIWAKLSKSNQFNERTLTISTNLFLLLGDILPVGQGYFFELSYRRHKTTHA